MPADTPPSYPIPPTWSPAAAYALAALFALIALVVRIGLDGWVAGVQFITFFPAVMASAWWLGVRPALLTALLGGLSAWLLLLPPYLSIAFHDRVQVTTLILYFAVAIPIAVALGTVRETRLVLARSEGRLRQLLGSMKEGFVLLDREFRVLDINAEGLRITDKERADVIGKTHWEAWPGSEETALGSLYRGALEDGRPRALTQDFPTPDGGEVWLEIRAYPSGDTLAIFFRNVTSRVEAERRLVETDRRLNAVLDNASVSIVLMDERQHCAYMNAAAERLTGYSFSETQGRPLHDVVHHTHPDGTPFPIEECPIDRAFPENSNVRGETTFVHKDGHFYPVAFTASPIRDEDANTIGTIIEVRDISAEKAAESHQRLLINELNHRVKNTLAIVQGVAAQTFRGDGVAEEIRRAFDGRLAALAAAHNILTQQNWEAASLAQIVRETTGLGCGADLARVSIAGPDLPIAPKTAVSIAMALHELCTNAMKYGALSEESGHVTVAWEVRDRGGDKRLRLVWTERGGPPVTAPARRGFGTRMIERGLAGELGGTAIIEFPPEGVVCTVDSPLPEPAA